ncbi:MAG: hypothetical protein M3209_09500 [Acidobacteriota bacterium]|nr:hypothetical protein [Acidobacteriota bacterium]
MAWISVSEALPVLGLKVKVKGEYTPETYPYPVSSLRDYGRGKIEWSSIEWRGTVAITHWWMDVEY